MNRKFLFDRRPLLTLCGTGWLLVAGAWIWLLGLHVSAETFYVSNDGDDVQAGTSESLAWRSLERAGRQRLEAGDQLLLRGGDVFRGALRIDSEGEGGTRARPIVIGSFGKGRAIIESPVSAVEVRSVPGIVVRDLVVRGPGTVGKAPRAAVGVRIVNTLPGARSLAFVRIENVEASGFGEAGIAIATETPDGSKSGFEDVEITRCTAHGNVFNGIRVGGTFDVKATSFAHRKVVIRHCRAYGNTGDPEYLENWSGNGIFVEDVDGALIEHCEAWENGALCHATVGGPVGIWAAIANDVTIQFCHSHHNRTGRGQDGGGFDFDGGVTHSLMQYNLSHDNDGPGFLLYTYAGAPHTFHHNVLRYCISRNDARKHTNATYSSLYVGHHGNAAGVHDLHIYGNIFEGSPTAGGASPPVVRIFGTREVRVENNVFISRGGVPLLDVQGGQQGLVLTGNIEQSVSADGPR